MTPGGKRIVLIAAVARNGVIGADGDIPWRLPADFAHFKRTTLGHTLLMGRSTYESIGRPLPGRLNIVVSRQADLRLEGAEVFGSLEDALVRADAWAREQGVDELMLIGGAQLYTQALPLAERLYLTRIELEPAGDAHFPEWLDHEWQRDSHAAHAAEGDAPAYAFEAWSRRRA